MSRESFLRDRAITSGVGVQDVDDEDQAAVDGEDLEVEVVGGDLDVDVEDHVVDVAGNDHVDKDLEVVSRGLMSISSRCFSVIFSKE